ncbi:MAG: cytochrome P450 [Nitrospira sp.]|nr:cytochrome P450 [Nitrospira sp.]
MTDQELRDEALTIFAAGHETTANALAWTWYLLATHPEARERFHEEVDRVLQGRTPTADDLPHLPYTRALLMNHSVCTRQHRQFSAKPRLARPSVACHCQKEHSS